MKPLNELLAPYAENGRTIEGQLAWLRDRKGFPVNIAEQAIQEVYAEMDGGKTFLDGNELDQVLLARAKEIREQDVKASIERMQNRISALVNPPIAGGRVRKAWKALTGKL
jgi:hypothetical protein